MSTVKIVGIVLIVAGALGLAYGGITYGSNTHEMQVGSMSMSVTEGRTFVTPVWAGLAIVLLGGALMLVPASKA